MNKQQLDELLKDHQIFHSDLQMDCFITGLSGGTPYGMYKQALRELDKRYRALRQLYIERERARMKIPAKVAARPRFKFQKRRALKAVEAGFALEDLERNICDTEREFTRFLQQARALKRKVGELTSEKRAALDEEFWVDRLGRTAAIDCMTTGRPNANTVECINAMPLLSRAGLLVDCRPENRDKLVEWYLGLPPPNIAALPSRGEVKALPILDVEALIGEADHRRLPAPDEAAEASGVTGFCRKQGGGRVRTLFRKAFSFVAVLTSYPVPPPVFNRRTDACLKCPQCSDPAGMDLWCGCCGCRRWRLGKISSALGYKNGKAAWRCPLSKPAFGPWKPDPPSLSQWLRELSDRDKGSGRG